MTQKLLEVDLTVNGSYVRAQVAPDLSLMRFLRDHLGLTGCKDGCSNGHCGACTVILDGRAQRACLVPIRRAAGCAVQTIEGLGSDGRLHPLQEAFIARSAVQCGFCTPGMIMSAKALLDATPSPTESQIRKTLTQNHNLCRCTGYVRIIEAIQDAAAAMAAARAILPGPETTNASQLRRDALQLVTGNTKFADDLVVPGMLFGKVRWSDHPYARIMSVDTAEAEAVPGVIAVLTARDVPGQNAFGRVISDQPALAGEVVRFIGDAVACAFAETAEAAADACALVQVTYEPLPGIFSPQAAAEPGAPRLHSGGNLLKETRIRRGDVEEAWAGCAEVVELHFTTPFVEHGYLEPEAGIGLPEPDGGVTVKIATQAAFEDRRQLAAILALPPEKVRVVQLPIGGGFGGKGDVHLHRFLALGALRTARPVKMTLTRSESLRTHTKRHASNIYVKAGADAQGKLLGLQTRVVLDGGAYASTSGGILEAGCVINTGPYFAPNLDLHGQVWYTNNITGAAMRGFGAPKIAFAVESTLDELARRLALDPLAFRLANVIEPGIPNVADHVQEPGIVTARETLLAAQSALSRETIPLSEGTRRIGVGVASMAKTVGVGRGMPDSAGAVVVLDADGCCEVRATYHEMGQGAYATLAALAAEELRIPVDRVRVAVPDTGVTPETTPTTASRQAFETGNAVVAAARELREELNARAAELLDANPSEIVIDGADLLDPTTGRRAPLGELAGRFTVEHRYFPPPTVPLPRDGQSSYGTPEFRSRPTNWCYDYATHVAIVEVDTANGAVRVLKYFAVHDVGKAINPAAVEGQIEGGVVMGIGYALSEQFIVENGINRTDTLAKCKLPTANQIPEIVPVVLEIPHPFGPHGAKGFAESPIVPVAPAILNAIRDAVGVRITDLPATPDRVLAALKACQGAPLRS